MMKILDHTQTNTSCEMPVNVPKPPLPPSEKKRDFTMYSFLPIKYPQLIQYYNMQKNVFWVTQDIDFSNDRNDWRTLDDNTKEFIKFILFFFAQADGIVNENLIENFKEETSDCKEARFFYAVQECIEVIHNETYSTLIDVYISDEKEKEQAFNAIQHYPAIRKIADWMFEWMKPNKSRLERLIAFACVEGILFSSAFAAIYWIKRKNILPGLCKANEFIARDEGIHTKFAIARYHVETTIDKRPKLKEMQVHNVISSATRVCEDFTREALKVDLIGINANEMVDYVKCTANSLCTSLGYNPIYNVINPFDWMAVISLPNKTNFFESKVSEYAKQKEADYVFDLNTEF